MSWSWKIEFLEIQNFNKLGVTWLGDPIVRGRLVERKRLMCGSTSKQLSWACTQFLSKSLLTWTCTYPVYIRRRVRVPGQGRPWRLSIKAPLLWHPRKSADQRSTRIRLNLLKMHLIFEGFWGTHFFTGIGGLSSANVRRWKHVKCCDLLFTYIFGLLIPILYFVSLNPFLGLVCTLAIRVRYPALIKWHSRICNMGTLYQWCCNRRLRLIDAHEIFRFGLGTFFFGSLPLPRGWTQTRIVHEFLANNLCSGVK